jgi:hypothetical protein
MQNHKRLQLRYFLRNANNLMLKYKKIFVYHYKHVRWHSSEPIPTHNLQQIGCEYQGWFEVGYDCIAEVWRYPSPKHRILIEMSLPAKNLLWHQDWVKRTKRLRKEKHQLDTYIKKMISKTRKLGHVIP